MAFCTTYKSMFHYSRSAVVLPWIQFRQVCVNTPDGTSKKAVLAASSTRVYQDLLLSDRLFLSTAPHGSRLSTAVRDKPAGHRTHSLLPFVRQGR